MALELKFEMKCGGSHDYDISTENEEISALARGERENENQYSAHFKFMKTFCLIT